MSLEEDIQIMLKKMDIYSVPEGMGYIDHQVDILKKKYENIDRRNIYAKINYYKLKGENLGDC